MTLRSMNETREALLARAETAEAAYLKLKVEVSTAFLGLSPEIEDFSIPQAIQWLRERLATDEAALAKWKDAVIDALVVDGIFQKEHEIDPRKAINDLLCWEAKMALDPAISKEAAALCASAPDARLRERLQSIFAITDTLWKQDASEAPLVFSSAIVDIHELSRTDALLASTPQPTEGFKTVQN